MAEAPYVTDNIKILYNEKTCICWTGGSQSSLSFSFLLCFFPIQVWTQKWKHFLNQFSCSSWIHLSLQKTHILFTFRTFQRYPQSHLWLPLVVQQLLHHLLYSPKIPTKTHFSFPLTGLGIAGKWSTLLGRSLLDGLVLGAPRPKLMFLNELKRFFFLLAVFKMCLGILGFVLIDFIATLPPPLVVILRAFDYFRLRNYEIERNAFL